jgi:3-hydroxyacyl-CoA dehydrogenase/enoyl-CoA hydratase/3-hydroxybutyryl-CoA epimerase
VKGRPDKWEPELVEALIEPYLNEAKAVLAEGIVADAELIDAGLIFGTGFAPFRGGPLHYLESRD